MYVYFMIILSKLNKTKKLQIEKLQIEKLILHAIYIYMPNILFMFYRPSDLNILIYCTNIVFKVIY